MLPTRMDGSDSQILASVLLSAKSLPHAQHSTLKYHLIARFHVINVNH